MCICVILKLFTIVTVFCNLLVLIHLLCLTLIIILQTRLVYMLHLNWAENAAEPFISSVAFFVFNFFIQLYFMYIFNLFSLVTRQNKRGLLSYTTLRYGCSSVGMSALSFTSYQWAFTNLHIWMSSMTVDDICILASFIL